MMLLLLMYAIVWSCNSLSLDYIVQTSVVIDPAALHIDMFQQAVADAMGLPPAMVLIEGMFANSTTHTTIYVSFDTEAHRYHFVQSVEKSRTFVNGYIIDSVVKVSSIPRTALPNYTGPPGSLGGKSGEGGSGDGSSGGGGGTVAIWVSLTGVGILFAGLVLYLFFIKPRHTDGHHHHHNNTNNGYTNLLLEDEPSTTTARQRGPGGITDNRSNSPIVYGPASIHRLELPLVEQQPSPVPFIGYNQNGHYQPISLRGSQLGLMPNSTDVRHESPLFAEPPYQPLPFNDTQHQPNNTQHQQQQTIVAPVPQHYQPYHYDAAGPTYTATPPAGGGGRTQQQLFVEYLGSQVEFMYIGACKQAALAYQAAWVLIGVLILMVTGNGLCKQQSRMLVQGSAWWI
eukprot:TRINITY_DN66226_c3_g1_i1.p1 TRINITY_DN66226_c3_g1~~TRINITY_DN66226_c3_g1_i1.p1  ORF type:complete len:399 (+),score=42.15 TRINITY_DN66226_c3_g1_i1:30-1226(+)